ncbi:DUF2243 domain-containing protein [Alkalibacillus haloalkaliphilus]|uniref:Membrane protein n=1 Tax=Alkalibacillus haloalkaliphilus TaxID=94136 RepID=A0A511W5A2_9BACI|nr:DUF2243 domain-containing protein [Alkalibacillus haloalkaliphilus]GEN46127.1 membrane protein [Alkalibacillus haloalkaliphilus]
MKKRNIWSGILFGIGVMGFIDELVFHQLLQWHHFYDWSTTEVGIFADGLFNAFAWFATIGGLFLLADLKRQQIFQRTRWWGAVILGAGVFQLFDGIVLHKILRVHQIRYVDNLIVYDLVWNIGSIILIIIGILLLRKATQHEVKEG